MPTTVTTLTVLGTACPWKCAGVAASGTANAMTAFNSKFTDGSIAGGASAGQNAAYAYGQQHTSPAGETAPTTLAVTPGQQIILTYTSGTVATQGAGAGNSTVIGSPTTTLTPVNVGESDNAGYTLPTNVIPGYRAYNINAVVSTSGTAVTWVSGATFSTLMNNSTVWINNTQFTVSSVTSPTTLTLSATAGTLTNVGLFFYSAKTNIGGLVGAFTDSSGNVLAGSLWDWASWNSSGAIGQQIGFVVPAGAAFITMGVNDTILRDNTGSFTITAYQFDTAMFTGDQTFPVRFPVNISIASWADNPAQNMKATVFMMTYFRPLCDFTPLGLLAGYTGQLWPHGAQNAGGTPSGTTGQNFAY